MSTSRFLDPQTGQFVDAELPTATVKFAWPERRGALVRATQGTIGANSGYIVGSYRITGSHYDLTPGTYSLRINRLSIGVHGGGHGYGAPSQIGSDNFFRQGTVYRWGIWHSRDGTVDVIGFSAPGHVHQVSGPLAPIYSFGPGTVQWGFLGAQHSHMGSHVDLIQRMEGQLGIENVDV